jgi:hypothetical protein
MREHIFQDKHQDFGKGNQLSVLILTTLKENIQIGLDYRFEDIDF